jgi:sugar/nucleoside kinase (ribokinase family)
MKFLVIGHLCLDVVHPADGPEREGYGGIYYTVATLSALCGKNDTVIPVFGVNAAEHEALVEHMRRFPNVDPGGIFRFNEPTNRVHLYYKDARTRIECSKDISAPIPYEKIRRHLSVDGILINMISGFDIALETLDHIRIAVRSHGIPLHLDYHCLTMGVRDGNERFRRPLPEWRRWAFMADTVQCNEEEIVGMTAERLSEQQTVGHLLSLGVKGVVVTRADRGATLFTAEHKRTVRSDVPGIRLESVADATGCGDVFGAAFHWQYVKSGDLLAAAQFANRAAAVKAGLRGIEEMPELGSLVREQE